MAIDKAKIIVQTKNTLLVVVGSLFLSIASAIFYLPYGIITGGTSGIAIIFKSLCGFDEQISIYVISWLMFLIGLIGLGKKFALKTLASTIVYPLGVTLFTFIYENVDFLKITPFDSNNGVSVGLLLAAMCGGLLTGLGCGITFLGGGSTGGLDIPSILVQKYAKIKLSISSFVLDASIILIGIFIIKDLELCLIGIIAAFLTSFMIDKIFFGGKKCYMAFIISEKFEEINSFVLEAMGRGSTIIDIKGGYSGNNFKMLQVCFDVKEYSIIKNKIESIDPSAFFMIVKANEIRGEGFTIQEELFEKVKIDEWIQKNKNNSEKQDGK